MIPILPITPILPILFFLTCLNPVALAWEGYDWKSWREITKSEKPTIESPQAGSSDLIPLMNSGGADSEKIDNIAGWEAKRDRILGTLKQLLGEPENNLKPLPPRAEVLDQKDMGTYIRRHLRIRSEADDWIPAYILFPKPMPTRPVPTIITLHQTVAQGKDEPCGIDGRAKGNPDLAFAVDLVQRGYVCIAPDMIGFGERIPAGSEPYTGALDFYRKHPHWSFFGKMAWDIQRIVDYLEHVEQVDPRRIGIMGHSHGAYGAIISAAFEPRISAVVASCGFTMLRVDPAPNRWSHLTALMPRLGFYVEDIKSAPIDWHEIISCLAPRPYFNWQTLQDSNFQHTENLEGIFEQLRHVYALYGAADWLSPHLEPGPHGFPSEAHTLAYEWLGRVLPARPAPLKTPKNKVEWEAYRAELKKVILRDLGSVAPPPLEKEFEVLSEEKREGYIERKISYLAAPDDPVNAYLLIPAGGGDKAGARHPGAIVFHQTVNEGKEEAVGHSGKPELAIASELARRGFIVLAPDSICAGERITSAGPFDTRDFYAWYPDGSAMGKMIQDGRRALDILLTLREVDSARMIVTGHSLGAEESLFVAAFDDRVKAAVASCGFAPIAADKTPDRWARDHWFSYLPRLRVDFRAGRLPAWDMDDVIRLVAPRGYYNFQTTEDEIFREGKEIDPLIAQSREVWKLYGEESNVQSILAPGPHSFPASAHEAAWEWMEKVLYNRNAAVAPK
ncbi:alpha/beta fold hydrolase [Candidatus Sumerlaeota bacterium]|nr:alpha/beta fold hydrolase [Candidatus Sumerlaeota bacterium]